MRIPERRAGQRTGQAADHVVATHCFYGLLDRLASRNGGPRRLAECSAETGWPRRGVYFFFEAGEMRSSPGGGLRVVRVGTHALRAGSRSSLWGRLAQHRGALSGTGNHRGSIFRLLIGAALARRHGIELPPSWEVGGDRRAAASKLGMSPAEITRAEAELEARVSRYIGDMPFLWLDVDDDPGPSSDRGLIERNAIALLSAYRVPASDPPSPDWLGGLCNRNRVRASGLWNNNHVDEDYSASFLDTMKKRVDSPGTPSGHTSNRPSQRPSP